MIKSIHSPFLINNLILNKPLKYTEEKYVREQKHQIIQSINNWSRMETWNNNKHAQSKFNLSSVGI
jgi:hypothetical protein